MNDKIQNKCGLSSFIRLGRFCQFGLRTVLLAVSIICIVCALVAKQYTTVRRRVLAAAALEEMGVYVEHKPEDTTWSRWIPLLDYVRGPQRGGREVIAHCDAFHSPSMHVVINHLVAFDDIDKLSLQRVTMDNRGLAGLEHLKELTCLDLSNTSVGDDDIRHITGLPKLKRVELLNTAVTDAGIMELRSIEALEILDITLSPVTDDGVRQLRRSVPHVKVVR